MPLKTASMNDKIINLENSRRQRRRDNDERIGQAQRPSGMLVTSAPAASQAPLAGLSAPQPARRPHPTSSRPDPAAPSATVPRAVQPATARTASPQTVSAATARIGAASQIPSARGGSSSALRREPVSRTDDVMRRQSPPEADQSRQGPLARYRPFARPGELSAREFRPTLNFNPRPTSAPDSSEASTQPSVTVLQRKKRHTRIRILSSFYIAPEGGAELSDQGTSEVIQFVSTLARLHDQEVPPQHPRMEESMRVRPLINKWMFPMRGYSWKWIPRPPHPDDREPVPPG